MDLPGKTAIVTGAGVRVGRALALGLAQRGANVVVHYNRSAGPAQEVVEEIHALGVGAIAAQADLASMAQLPMVVSAGVEAFGQVDILVNSAAIWEPGTVLDATEDNWDRHMTINCKAPFFLSQAFARNLAPGQRGHIINIVDWRAVRPGVAYVPYTIAKAGLLAMTKSLAVGLGPDVQVNAIAPGAILPPVGEDGGYFDRVAHTIPAKRTGAPGELVKAMLYLLDADFVTGELIYVTGGQHL